MSMFIFAAPPRKIKQHIRLHIGDYYASRRPVMISTLLGSCVAVCMFDPVAHIGGMNHILLPGKADMRKFDMSARFGINAMELLINKIMNLGGERRRLIAKVFGGGRILPAISEENCMGKKNVEFVLEFMKTESFRIVSRDVGGTQSRRIYFHADTGDVFLKRGKPFSFRDIAIMERKMQERISRQILRPGDVTLFQ
ncbi:MAG: chemotaxis protein CheD [Desulfococcaceae bacterium]|nr:chemotaxis protein CheD [Desulfococcaceae bacterium]